MNKNNYKLIRHIIYFTNVKILAHAFATATLFLLSFCSQAQYSFSPSTTLMKNQNFNDVTYDSIAIINNSSSTLSLKWGLISLDTTSGGYFDLCASGNCYPGIPMTGTFPDIAPNQYGWLGMHFWSGNISTVNKATIFIYEASNPSVGDTLSFILNVIGINGTHNHHTSNSFFSIYPNPTTDDIRILTSSNDLFSAYLYTPLGHKLKYTINNNIISLKNLDSGNYFIVIEDQYGNHYSHSVQKTKQP